MWHGVTGEIFFHLGCVVDFQLRLGLDLHKAQHTLGFRFTTGKCWFSLKGNGVESLFPVPARGTEKASALPSRKGGAIQYSRIAGLDANQRGGEDKWQW